MATPSYPSTLIGPNANGFSLAKKNFKANIVTDMDSIRDRRMVSANVYVITAEFHFKQDSEFTEFLKWIKYDLRYADFWFEADWFSDIGLEAGKWAFRFVNLPISASGHSLNHSCTILAGPRNDNIVNAEYTEKGMKGPFFDPATEVECVELPYLRTFRYSSQLGELETVDFNGSNWTVIGTPFNLSAPVSMTNTRSITAMQSDHVAIVNNTTISTLRMMKWDDATGTFSQLGTGTGLAGYSTINTRITRLNFDTIALFDGGLKTLSTWQFDYNTNTWAIVGNPFDVTAYITIASNGSITALSPTSIAFISNNTAKLVTFDFDGTDWSQNGAVLNVYLSSVTNYTISAMNANEIVLTHDNNTGAVHTYEKRLTKFTFSGGAWTPGTPSVQFANGGVPRVAAMTPIKIAMARSDGANMGAIAADFGVSTFTDIGNFLRIGTGADSNIQLTSYFIPE